MWSNKRGWTNGKGRYAMLIVTEVSATGLAKGYYLWGPPTKQSWVKDVAGYKSFAEFISNDKFSINGTPVTAKLDKNVLALTSVNKEKPSETANIELRPVWQLVPVPEDAEPPTKRDKTVATSCSQERERGRTWPSGSCRRSEYGRALSSVQKARERICPARRMRAKRHDLIFRSTTTRQRGATSARSSDSSVEALAQ